MILTEIEFRGPSIGIRIRLVDADEIEIHIHVGYLELDGGKYRFEKFFGFVQLQFLCSTGGLLDIFPICP